MLTRGRPAASLARRSSTLLLRPYGQAYSSSTMRTDEASTHDVVVVGGGVMGVWAAINARKLGASVALADQFPPAHEHGSSHGDGRIYRFAYIEDLYVDMMERSLPLWKELQSFAGHPLLAQTGGLQSAPCGTGRLSDQIALYERRGIAYESLSAGEVNERFPQFRLTEGVDEAIYQHEFGVLFASKCISAAWRYAQSLGVETVSPFRAAALHQAKAKGGAGDSGRLVVEGIDGTSLSARSVVFAPGAWLTSLSSSLLGLSVPTLVSAETVCYYAPKADAPAGIDHSYNSMPCFVSEYDNGLGPFGYYGLPMIDIPGIKASAHYCGPAVHPDRRPTSAGGAEPGVVDAKAEEAAAARINEVVRSTSRLIAMHNPHVEPQPFTTQSCLYTVTPDHDYIISTVPTMPDNNVVLIGGGSGHAFKMGPAIGEGAAALALGLPSPFALDQFDVRRLLSLGEADMDHEANAPRK